MAFYSVGQIRQANERSGQHFFEPGTMRFFGSRVGNKVHGGAFFVTSEQSGFDPASPRRYSLRFARPDGHVEQVGEFLAYGTQARAEAAIKRALKEEPRVEQVREDQHGGADPEHLIWQAFLGELPVYLPTAKAEAEAICEEIRAAKDPRRHDDRDEGAAERDKETMRDEGRPIEDRREAFRRHNRRQTA